MRVVAFANKGGADEIAAAANLPAAFAKAGHSILHIDPDSQAGACRWPDVRNSRACFSLFHDNLSFACVNLARFALLCYGLGLINSLLRLTTAGATPFWRLAPSRNTIYSQEKHSIQKTPLRHIRRFISSSNGFEKTKSSYIESYAPPKGVSSDVLLSKKKPQLPKPELRRCQR